jgi:transposase InsO family protein
VPREPLDAPKNLPKQGLFADNGSAYRTHLYAQACRRWGCRQLFTRPYTPRTNGKAERFIQSLLPSATTCAAWRRGWRIASSSSASSARPRGGRAAGRL